MLHRSQTARYVLCLGHCSPTLCHRVFLVSSHLHLTGISPPEQTQGQHQRRHFVMTKVPAPPVPSIATRQSLDVRRRAFSRLSTCFDAVNWGSKIRTQLATGGLCFRCRLSAHHVTAVPIMSTATQAQAQGAFWLRQARCTDGEATMSFPPAEASPHEAHRLWHFSAHDHLYCSPLVDLLFDHFLQPWLSDALVGCLATSCATIADGP